jgi:hypothetical protein
MRVVVLQSNYLPWKGYIDLIHDADVFVWYDEVQYTKNDWRNRNRLYSKNGLQWLTIPIDRDAVKQKISEVRLPDPRWQKDHFKSIYFAYKPAPCFGQIEPWLREVYEQTQWDFLARLNRHCVESLCALLGIRTQFRDSKDFTLEGDRVPRLVNLLRQLGATEYISGPSAKEYTAGSEHLFSEAGIKLTWKDYAGYPAYRQLREPFEHGVSILDLLANVSLAKAPHYIWGWRQEA